MTDTTTIKIGDTAWIDSPNHDSDFPAIITHIYPNGTVTVNINDHPVDFELDDINHVDPSTPSGDDICNRLNHVISDLAAFLDSRDEANETGDVRSDYSPTTNILRDLHHLHTHLTGLISER